MGEALYHLLFKAANTLDGRLAPEQWTREDANNLWSIVNRVKRFFNIPDDGAYGD